jgi:CNT family concentrative nucleoside transporter
MGGLEQVHFGRFHGLIGVVFLLLIGYALSNNRRRIDWRPVLQGLMLQVLFAILILKTQVGSWLFTQGDRLAQNLLAFSDAGTDLLLRSHVDGEVSSSLINLAFRTLPTVIFFSALTSLLYHLGIMQLIVKAFAWVMVRTMGTSGAESLSCAADIFVGQTEAPLLIKPFLPTMTRSELMAIMTAGFATIAGGVMMVYISMLGDIPNIAGHLLTASVMNAPAALVFAKLMYPEVEEPLTRGQLQVPVVQSSVNLFEAIANGATDGLKLTANIAAMLLAFTALVQMCNAGLSYFNVSLESLLGIPFRPIAWAMGATGQDTEVVARLLGKKTALNEFLAYRDMQGLVGTMSKKSAIIASYALCGFANFASMGVQIGGLGALAPERKSVVAELALRSMWAGAMASCLSGCLAGILIG